VRLGDARPGEVMIVEAVRGERAFRRRLLELGLLPGTRVELRRVAPLGDPLELLVRGTALSIRKADAAQIEAVITHERATAEGHEGAE
jgi:ferrous iron transport protein A